MKIAFLHYHLKTGGVTSVIKNQILALQGVCEMLVITGDQSETVLPCPIVEIPSLGYDQPGIPTPSPKIIAQQIRKALAARWTGGCDILHIHNPILAKNQSLIPSINLLQKSGLNIFCQIHDFAEDGRPEVYSQESYPANCHYGVINSRDRQILLQSGLSTSGLHLIPNAVSMDQGKYEPMPGGLVFYPVRAIRRKNIGEAILLSLFLEPQHYLGISQPPHSVRDRTSYIYWQTFVKKHGLNVQFEIGQKNEYLDLLASASSMVTTSIMEGFGFSFLEPWTTGKLLWGRRLADICKDFEKNSLDLNSLYNSLMVPLEWMDIDCFFRKWQTRFVQAADMYNLAIDQAVIDHQLDRIKNDGYLDFGLLDETSQAQIITYLLSNPTAKRQITDLNPLIAEPLSTIATQVSIENNRRVINKNYNIDRYQERLLAIYQRISHAPVQQSINKQVLLDSFFDPNHFPLLKWGYFHA